MANTKREQLENEDRSQEASVVEPLPVSQKEASTYDIMEQLKQAREVIALLHQQHDALADTLRAKGVHVEEPPTEITAYRREETGPVAGQARPRRPGGSAGTLDLEFPYGKLSDAWWPWTKDDLGGGEKYDFVPQYLPGVVHPLRDKDGKFKIFLNVNDLTACLTVGVLNRQISGMFYHAYMNAEESYLRSEDYKQNGPLNAIWVAGGLHGTNTWHFEPETPNPWIDINGRYYQPGAEMPGEEIPNVRPDR